MPAFTNFLGLYKPGGGSTGLILPDEVVDIDRINSNMDAIDLFAKGWGQSADRNHQFYGPAASLAGVTGMKLGDTYQESDGSKVLWAFDGTNWVRNEPGLCLIKPTAITGMTASADGTLVLSGTPASLVVDGAFSSRFRSYRIIFQVKCSAASGIGVLMQFRRAGTNITGATDYGQTRIAGNGSTLASSGGTNPNFDLVSTGGQYVAGEIVVNNPGFNGFKSILSNVTCATSTPITNVVHGVNGGASALTPFDGFRIYASTGTFDADSGKSFVKIYGLV